jgi:hypothetical protein
MPEDSGDGPIGVNRWRLSTMRKTAEIGAFADYRLQARHGGKRRRKFGLIEQPKYSLELQCNGITLVRNAIRE